MVLQELGGQISEALRKLAKAPKVDEAAIDAVLKEVCGALLRSDVNVKIVQTVRANIKAEAMQATQVAGSNRVKNVERAVFNELVRLVSPASKPFEPKRGRPNVFMFVGLQGSGKTTTIAKFANYWARKGWKTAMVCCDTFRAGAYDQLKQNAIKLHVPFYGDVSEADPVRLAEAGTRSFREKGYEVILVDTSGRHKQESDLFEEMEQVRAAVQPNEVIFVMDSTIGQAVADQAQAFKESVPVGSVIITKLDGHAKGGGAISAVAATDAPITFIGTGEHFDNLERFDAEAFVGQLLGRGNVKALAEKLKDVTGGAASKELSERILKGGNLTLRDFREQLQSMSKMGGLSSMLGMLPGQMGQLAGQLPAEQSNRAFRVFLTIMDSMTNDELDGIFKTRVPDPSAPGKLTVVYEKSLSLSRMRRIAKGAGVTLAEVQQLMMAFKQNESMLGGIGKQANMSPMQQAKQQAAMMKGGGSREQMLQAHLKKSLPPGMLDQMGGSKGVMEMMKGMDIGAMAQQMGMQLPPGKGGGPAQRGDKRR
jgi:signal recognition particle subunit SRP54